MELPTLCYNANCKLLPELGIVDVLQMVASEVQGPQVLHVLQQEAVTVAFQEAVEDVVLKIEGLQAREVIEVVVGDVVALVVRHVQERQ